jgi:hypothetical protein
MLIKSVIKALCRRLIVVILRLIKKQGLCYMWLTINMLCAMYAYLNIIGVFFVKGKKK